MSDEWVVTMPKLGETVTEGEITSWFKAAGDEVAFDDPLFEVSTDKVDSEIPSPYDGVLLEILVESGATVPIGTPIARIGEPGAAAGTAATGPAPATQAGAAPPAAPTPPAAPAGAAAAAGAGSGDPRDQVEPLSRMRLAVAEGMMRSLAASAHVWTSVEVDFDNIERVRRRHKDRFRKETGASLSYLPFVARATVDA